MNVSNIDNQLQRCLGFLNEIGIQFEFGKITEPGFLPGLSIRSGRIIIDYENLENPGDILHEAGHIAVVSRSEWSELSDSNVGLRAMNEAEEMMAIAWSYAACIYLDIDPDYVFHPNGYGGGGNYISENFKNKNYFGVPTLQWKGMTVDEKNAQSLNTKPYPQMIRWTIE